MPKTAGSRPKIEEISGVFQAAVGTAGGLLGGMNGV